MPDRSKWKFGTFGGDGSATDGVDITPNDGADLVHSVRGLYVGGQGDVRITTLTGTELTFVAVQGILPVGADRVHATGTTATSIIGLI